MTDPPICPKCKGDVVKTGTRRYIAGLYQMYRCSQCGHQFKGEEIKNV